MESTPDDNKSNEELPPWHRLDWTGPKVELRDEAADGHAWPEGAAERVVFTPQDFPNGPAEHFLPFTQFFGAEGWPLNCPSDLWPQLDPRMKAEFRARPWSASGWSRSDWLFEASDFQRFQNWNEQAGLLNTSLASLTRQCG